MKPLIKLLLLSFCLLFYTDVLSQNKLGDDGSIPGSSSSSYSNTQTSSGGSSSLTTQQELGIPSSIYFNNWTSGTVVLKDQTAYDNWLLRYNIYTQQMQYISDGDTAALGNPEDISSITIEEHTFLFEDFECENNIPRKGYLELLVNGNCKLYLHRCIAFRYVDECAEPGAENVKEEYYMAKRYFISDNGSLPVLLPEKKKALIAILNDDNKDIKLFIKENNIKLCNEDDLKELFSYYNQK